MSQIRSAPSERRGRTGTPLHHACFFWTFGWTLSPKRGHQRSSEEGFFEEGSKAIVSTNVTSEPERSTQRQMRPRHRHHHGNDTAICTVAAISSRCSSLAVLSPSNRRLLSSARPRLLSLESTSFEGSLNMREQPFPAPERQLHFVFVGLTVFSPAKQAGVYERLLERSIASRIPVWKRRLATPMHQLLLLLLLLSGTGWNRLNLSSNGGLRPVWKPPQTASILP